MSENTLIAKIKQEAAQTVEEIKAAGAAEIAAIQRETDAMEAALKAEHEHALQKKLAHRELVAVSKAKQDANIALQTAKRAEIDDLFAEVAQELAARPAEDYVRIFSGYATKLVPSDIVGASVSAPEGRLAETKEILTKLFCTGEIVTDNTIKAGLVIRTADGVYDITLERLFDGKRADLEIEVIKQLTK